MFEVGALGFLAYVIHPEQHSMLDGQCPRALYLCHEIMKLVINGYILQQGKQHMYLYVRYLTAVSTMVGGNREETGGNTGPSAGC